MSIARLITIGLALLGAAVGLIILLCAFLSAPFSLQPLMGDELLNTASRSPAQTPFNPELMAHYPLLYVGMFFLMALHLGAYITMPAPWYRGILFRRRVNYVLQAAGVVGFLLLVACVAPPIQKMMTGEHVQRTQAGYAVYQQGARVRDIDAVEFEQMKQQQTGDLNRAMWEGLSALLTVNCLAVAGYGWWYLKREA
jgi:hypothetical protein